MQEIHNYSEKLDKTDWRILYELDMDARQPYSALARKLRLSKEGAAYRVKRLQERGIIRGFNAIVDISALGYIGGRFMIRFQHCDQKKEAEIVDYFKKRKDAWWVNSRGGSYHLGAAFWEKNIHEIHAFQDDFLKKYWANIATKETAPAIYHRIYHFSRAYLAGKKAREEGAKVTWDAREQECDRTDRAILSLVASDCRLSIVETARRLRLTPAIVKYRLGKMEERGIILGYRTALDLEKIGYYWYKIELYISDFERKKELIAFASAHPNIVYAYDLIGGADLELEAEVRNTDELLGIINEMREKFSDLITSYDYYLWSREHKLAFVPE